MKKMNLLVTLGVAALSSLAMAGESGHWSYSGEAGPEHWGSLEPAFGLCSSGKNQSPIDLKDFVEADLKPISVAYKAGGNEIVNNGHTVQVNFQEGGGIDLQGRAYALKQFHFHAPSENQVNGHSFPMEAHFVHADASGNLAVIAVFFEEGAANPALAKALARLPKNSGEKLALTPPLQADSLMPASKDYYRFNGSLTTPPCTEGVLWLVMKTPIAASKDQINQFKGALHHANNRPVQPINARMVAE